MALDFRSDIELTNVKTLPLNGKNNKVNVNQKVSLQNMMPLSGGIDLSTLLTNENFFTNTTVTISNNTGSTTVSGLKLNINNLVSVGRYFCNAVANKIIAIGDSSGNIITVPTINSGDPDKTGLIFDVIISNKIGDMTHDKPNSIDSSWRYYMQILRIHDNITVANQEKTDACIVEWRRHMHDSIGDKGHEWTFGDWQKCILPVTKTAGGTEYTFLPNFKSNTVTTDTINASGGTISGAAISGGSVSDANINDATITRGKVSSATITGGSVSNADISSTNSGYPDKNVLFGDSGILKDIDNRLKGLGFNGGYELQLTLNNGKVINLGRVAQIGTIVYGYLYCEEYMLQLNNYTLTLPSSIGTAYSETIINIYGKGSHNTVVDTYMSKITIDKGTRILKFASEKAFLQQNKKFYFWYETKVSPTIEKNYKEEEFTSYVSFDLKPGSLGGGKYYTHIGYVDMPQNTESILDTDLSVNYEPTPAIISRTFSSNQLTLYIYFSDTSDDAATIHADVTVKYKIK